MLLIGIVLMAYPKFRLTHHDAFERAHRFLGWTATALVWCQVVLLTNDYRSPGETLGHALLHAPPFWLVLIMSCSIILPWLRLRKVPVRAVVLSNLARDLEERVPELAKIESLQTGRAIREMKAQVRPYLKVVGRPKLMG